MKTNTFAKIGTGIALSLVTSTLLHATNGDTLIGVGAKARGMGGVGIGMSHGAESTLANPAMITNIQGTEISFGGTVFMPNITTTVNTVQGMPAQDAIDSDADINMIPEVSLAHKINDNWYIGIGMWGTAGMGTDYRDNMNLRTGQFGNLNMVTNLQLMQFAVPVAYKSGGLSVAVAPILQYGNLDINYNMPDPANLSAGAPGVGAGLAQDFGFGWSAGLAYDFDNGLTLGAVYKSAIEMNYNGQLSTAMAPFNGMINGMNQMLGAPFYNTLNDSDTLEQPAEYGLGLSYVMGGHTFAIDYKKIKWSSASGYKDFEWEDQNVLAVGYQYAQNNWALRIGYNQASSPVNEKSAGQRDPNFIRYSALNFFNLLGFPATQEKHLTLGGTYEFSNTFSLDLAYVHGFSNKETFDVPAFSAYPNMGMPGQQPPYGYGVSSITTDHSENSLSFQLTYKF